MKKNKINFLYSLLFIATVSYTMEEQSSYRLFIHDRAYKSDPLMHPINRRLLHDPLQTSSEKVCSSPRAIQKQYIRDLTNYEYMENDQKLQSALINHPELVANLVTKRGESVLHFVVQKNHISLMNQAIGAGTDVSGLNDFNITPLSYAATKLNLQAMEALIDNGCIVSSKSLHALNMAKKLKNISLEETLSLQKSALLLFFAHGVDVNAHGYPFSQTVLFNVIEHDHLPLAEFLLDYGAKVDVKNEKNETPLDKVKSAEALNLLHRYLRK